MDDFVSYETMDRGKDSRWKGFLDWLKQMRDGLSKLDNIHYFRAPALVQRANQEIKSILDKVYKIIFDEQARLGFQTLLSLIHQEEHTYCFTHYEDEDTLEDICPCQLLRDYFASMISNIEDDSTLSQELYVFFHENNYSFDV